MVRVGGMGYTCSPKESIGNRISNMTFLETGKAIDPQKNYVVAGWASVNEDVTGPPIYELMERHIRDKEVVNMQPNTAVIVEGMG